MSQTVVSTTRSADGQWQTVKFSDGSTSLEAVPGSATATAITNAGTLRDKVAQALTNNATFLAITSPSAAQTTAQVKALTRQMSALIRLVVVQDFSDISGT